MSVDTSFVKIDFKKLFGSSHHELRFLLEAWETSGRSNSLGEVFTQLGPSVRGQLLKSLSVWFCSPTIEKDEQGPISEAWDVDPGLITKLKEQYRKERKGKKGVKSKSCQAVPASLPSSSSSLWV